ncbi:hypothetical protein ACHAWT_000721 [Skeletonema menzelii]
MLNTTHQHDKIAAMRFLILRRVLCSRQAATKGYTNKPADNIPTEDGSATTIDDDSSTSSNMSTNANDSDSSSSSSSSSSNRNSRKSPPRKKYPLLYSSSSPSTAPSKALSARIQLALSIFMKKPIPQNWRHLVSLLRGENVQLQLGGAAPSLSSSSSVPHNKGMKRTLARLEKSLADELTVYEAEDDDAEEEELEKERAELAVDGEPVMELLAPEAPELGNCSDDAEMESGGSQYSGEAELDIPVSAAKSFINRPSTGNWELLVQLFRNENIQRFDSNKNAPHEILSVGSDLTFDDSLEAMEDNNPKTLSVIYESDEDYDTEDGGEGEESIVGLGLLPEMYCPDEMDSVDYESDDSEGVGVQKEDHVHEKDHNEAGDDQGRGAVAATDGESPEAPFAGQIDWPFPDEKETAAAAAAAAATPSRASTVARQSTTKKPPSFANTKAKAYVILWERRIRRFDQNQVNVVQKSVHPRNVIRSSELSKMADSRSKEEMTMHTTPKANANARIKSDKLAPRKRIDIVSPPLLKMTKAGARDEDRSPTSTNCTPSVTFSTSTALWNMNVRDEVMNWENKLKSTHTDVHRVLFGLV